MFINMEYKARIIIVLSKDTEQGLMAYQQCNLGQHLEFSKFDTFPRISDEALLVQSHNSSQRMPPKSMYKIC